MSNEEVLINKDAEDLEAILAVKEKYQGEIAARKWCRGIAESMLTSYVTVDPVYLFTPFGEIEGVTVVEEDDEVILSKGKVSQSYYLSANIADIICKVGVIIPKTEGLSYDSKLRIVKQYLVPFCKELEQYFTLE